MNFIKLDRPYYIFFIFAWLSTWSTPSFALAPQSNQNHDLQLAILNLQKWQASNPKSTPIPGKLRQTNLHQAAKRYYEEWNVRNLPIQHRIAYARNIFKGYNGKITPVLDELSKWISTHPDYFTSGDLLTPEGYFQMDRIFHSLPYLKKHFKLTSREDLIDVTICLDWFIFNFSHEDKGILYYTWLLKEIQKEMDNPGTGRIPEVWTISDEHGGSNRFIPVLAFILGLPKNNNITTLAALKQALIDQKIEPNPYLRINGLSDIPDRGPHPIECQKVVQWLCDELGVGRFIVGNHDLYRMMGVLGIFKHPLFNKWFDGAKKSKDIPEEAIENSPAFHAHEAIYHSGWGSCEADEWNEILINEIIHKINTEHGLNPDQRLKPIKIIKWRMDTLEPEVNALKKENVQRRESGLDPHPVPDMFQKTLSHTFEEIDKLNAQIKKLNQEGLSIDPIDFEPYTLETFPKVKGALEHTYWVGMNFRLFDVDHLGGLDFHAIPPFLNKGKDYRFNIQFEGKVGLAAKDAIENKVQKYFSSFGSMENFVKTFQDPQKSYEEMLRLWDEIGEALTIVDSMYSDIKKTAKLEDVQKMLDEGGHLICKSVSSTPASLHRRSPLPGGALKIGHNDSGKREKHKLDWIYFQEADELLGCVVHTDIGFSPLYGNRGGAVVEGRHPDGEAKGFALYGYNTSDSKEVEEMSSDFFLNDNPFNQNRQQKLLDTQTWGLLKSRGLLMYLTENLWNNLNNESLEYKKSYYKGLADSLSLHFSNTHLRQQLHPPQRNEDLEQAA